MNTARPHITFQPNADARWLLDDEECPSTNPRAIKFRPVLAAVA